MGVRGEHKRQADEKAKRPCPRCGTPIWAHADLCRPCWAEQQHAAVWRRRNAIQERWMAGESIRQIASAIGSTPNSVGVEMARMRADGWELPFRYHRAKAAA